MSMLSGDGGGGGGGGGEESSGEKIEVDCLHSLARLVVGQR